MIGFQRDPCNQLKFVGSQVIELEDLSPTTSKRMINGQITPRALAKSEKTGKVQSGEMERFPPLHPIAKVPTRNSFKTVIGLQLTDLIFRNLTLLHGTLRNVAISICNT